MKSCIRIPRLFIPGSDEAQWAASDGAPAGEGGESVLSCAADGVPFDAEELRENTFAALETGRIHRVERGFMLVRRSTAQGLRKGILALADLEEFETPKGAVRNLTETDPALVERKLAVRRRAVMEFPHTVICYRDKRGKLMRALESEEIEELYGFGTPSGGRVEGLFVPDFIAEDYVHELMRCADPCFGVLSGNHALAAAKKFWEELKPTLSASEARNHPARFALAEFVNLADDAVMPYADGKPAKKEELLAMLKAGKKFPAGTLTLGEERLCFEGREISYD